jgi:hypothetical protein
MFYEQPELDFTMEEWQNCRDFYLKVSQERGLPENLVWASRGRARFAAENVRRAVREIDKLNDEFYMPAFTGDRNVK